MQKESEEMIRQYSFAKNGDRRLAPDFKVREFRCKDGTDTVMVDEVLTVALQCIREHFGKPVTITSGYRTAAHKKPLLNGPSAKIIRPAVSSVKKFRHFRRFRKRFRFREPPTVTPVPHPAPSSR